ncbi:MULTISPECIES: fumarylacetoacetate hydrolase family protein [unclassified Pseudonocardia]|uniref:fumarylacetoacetate hydrolase family protein n=1 Tax=unclassified Pseudonocardia TaxID=2619320 RepID=UPI0001FFED03|nr:MULTISPECIES: fumarylacetoacetate hydrolase family protein [unclassified Pseudonocardia]ALE74120.1 2-hydroxyhepta-2,4-diene-1,7-dioate isomerase [Pseudonocardia sp. EC080625-04]ALL77533.1 2-hydroxyhepta-2,4-diene-1,7-dioate isomerase [Pseudonocardia sp. EC080610-09]ALL80449.1 2-hydroxyhepta-2,4-diene-1,7-dioate isomerase [Pseudonocardia sp. EC080619-01]OLM17747.1 Fumarylacetoacetate hydrolase family protein [Pseudonocardia sp. Ae707_Ps1]
MRLATIRTATGHRAVRVDGDSAVETGEADVRALLERPDWAEHAATADGPVHDAAALDLAPLVPSPEKIICVGLNYRDHVLEMGNELPEYPTIFGKFAPALIGARDEIELPPESDRVDFEAELTVVIGQAVRHADAESARAAIAGYTVLNDVSMRDYQRRTKQFLQGKTWEHSTPLGPELVTPDELTADPADGGALRIRSELGGETMQDSTTDQLVFGVVDLIVYLSTILTLNPGDVIATGTPGGVGDARTPPRYLTDGCEIVTAVEGIGECRNVARALR